MCDTLVTCVGDKRVMFLYHLIQKLMFFDWRIFQDSIQERSLWEIEWLVLLQKPLKLIEISLFC